MHTHLISLYFILALCALCGLLISELLAGSPQRHPSSALSGCTQRGMFPEQLEQVWVVMVTQKNTPICGPVSPSLFQYGTSVNCSRGRRIPLNDPHCTFVVFFILCDWRPSVTWCNSPQIYAAVITVRWPASANGIRQEKRAANAEMLQLWKHMQKPKAKITAGTQKRKNCIDNKIQQGPNKLKHWNIGAPGL